MPQDCHHPDCGILCDIHIRLERGEKVEQRRLVDAYETAQIMELHDRGLSLSAIGREVGRSKNTVAKVVARQVAATEVARERA